MRNIRLSVLSAALAIGLAPASSWAFTDTFSATGTVGGSSVSSTATFTSSGSTLTVTLTETSAAANAGQLLDGLFFTMSGANPTLGSAPTPTAIASKLFTAANPPSPNVNITGGWLLAQPVNGFAYGLSAVGGGGLFPANEFTLGKGGSDDYGIAGAGTDFSAPDINNKLPLVEDTVTFTLTGLDGSVTGISGVEFGYNSNLSATLTGTCTEGCSREHVPEPTGIAVFGFALAGLGLLRRRGNA